MPKRLEPAADVVTAHASTTTMTKDELFAEVAAVYQALKALDKGEAAPVAEQTVETTGPALSEIKGFGKAKVYA